MNENRGGRGGGRMNEECQIGQRSNLSCQSRAALRGSPHHDNIAARNIPNTLDVSTPVLIPSVVASLDRHSVSINKLQCSQNEGVAGEFH